MCEGFWFISCRLWQIKSPSAFQRDGLEGLGESWRLSSNTLSGERSGTVRRRKEIARILCLGYHAPP